MPEFVAEAEPAGMVPMPSPDSFGPDSADDRVSDPSMFHEEEESEAKDDDIIAQSQFHEEEEGAAQDDGIVAQSQFHEEEEGAAQDDGIIAESQFHDEEEGAVQDDGIIAQSQFHEEEEGAAQEEDLLARNVYGDDDSGIAEEEGITEQRMYHEEEEGAPQEEGITAQSQYHEEEEGAATTDDILAHNVYGEDDSGKVPEEGISGPKTPPEEKIAQADTQPPKPVVVLPVTVTVESEPLFDFDKTAIRADSKSKLDDLIRQLKGVTYEEVVAVGFADPIGSVKYNQKLSERRASAVKAYLVSRGIPADKIKTEGRGETEEYASYKSCNGLHKKKLIACFQPNRRVEVTVTAQKQQ